MITKMGRNFFRYCYFIPLIYGLSILIPCMVDKGLEMLCMVLTIEKLQDFFGVKYYFNQLFEACNIRHGSRLQVPPATIASPKNLRLYLDVKDKWAVSKVFWSFLVVYILRCPVMGFKGSSMYLGV